MIVIDASILVNALTDDGPLGEAGRAELARDVHWAAPEHLLVESFSAIRGLVLGKKIGGARARDAIEAMASAAIELLPSASLLARMWQLRDVVSGYDAAYAAAAETAACPLVTADARLARARGLGCPIRLGIPFTE